MTADTPDAPAARTVGAASAATAPSNATSAPPGRDAKALSPASRRAYDADWAVFQAWCLGTGHAALPADAETLVRYLSDPAPTQELRGPRGLRGRRAGPRSRGTLDRCLAAIARAHRARGLPAPTDDPAVRQRLRATKRQVALRPRRGRPPTAAQLTRMASACLGDLAGLRDRALLLLAAAGLGRAPSGVIPTARRAVGTFDPSALAGLDLEHVRFTAMAVELSLRAADPDGDTPRRLAVPCGATVSVCPVQALRDWLRASDCQFGPVFRKVDRWGNVEHRRLGTDAIRLVLARRTPRRARRSRKAKP